MRGQSFLEVIFAVGIIMLTATGVVSLLVSSAGSRKRSVDLKRASELSEKVMESLSQQEDGYPTNFWQLRSVGATADAGFPGYQYSVNFLYVTGVDYPNCNVGTTNCTEVVVDVGWTSGVGVTSTHRSTKFFS